MEKNRNMNERRTQFVKKRPKEAEKKGNDKISLSYNIIKSSRYRDILNQFIKKYRFEKNLAKF